MAIPPHIKMKWGHFTGFWGGSNYPQRSGTRPDAEAREAERQRLVAEVGEGTSPYEAAGTMRVDEIIDPADTRVLLAEELNRLANRPLPPLEQRPLAWWPTC